MIGENNALEKLVDTFMEDAQNAHKHLLRKLGSSLKTIDKLNSLIEKAKFLLEEKFKHVNELYSLLSDQHGLAKSIKCSLEAMTKHKEKLDAVLNVLQSKSKSFAHLISELEDDLKQIFRNFGNVKGNLEIKVKLESENNANFSELKRLLKLLDADKQDVVKVGKQLGKLKRLTEAEIEKDKNETLKEINDQSYQEEENRSVWEKKIKSVFEFIAELRAMVAENKEEEETDISQLKHAFDETCNFKEEERVRETLKLSKAFVCSDETTGKVCTVSGFNEMQEITYLQRDDDVFGETNLATKQTFKSSYAIASQNVENIPENAEQRLKGIFYRQGGKKSIKK
ncbi:golgin subfamily A member 6-like protein 22 [Centruroides vittatus]|uniref:golgin subfamily A member 6-like protein 22 n=1 Tax=Centruroides vittatus TaxID=120091 RepID=UPI00350ED537